VAGDVIEEAVEHAAGAVWKKIAGLGVGFGVELVWELVKMGLTESEAKKLPPIWTELELTVYYDGTYDARVRRHSLYPNLSVYCGGRHRLPLSFDGGKTFSPIVPVEPDKAVEDYYLVSGYDATRNLRNWQGHGWGAVSGIDGPSGGNPWNATKPAHDFQGVGDHSTGEPAYGETKEFSSADLLNSGPQR
jgi:hypothetical protein